MDPSTKPQDTTFQLLHESQFPRGIIKPWMLASTPTMAAGDLYYSDGSIFQRLAVGTAGQYLKLSTTKTPSWATIATPSISELDDTNGAPVIKTTAATTPVNQLTVANAAASAAPTISATGTDTNIPIVLAPKGSALVKGKILEQDITTNNYRANAVTLTGWSFITGDGASANYTVTIGFGITFTTAPVVVISFTGYKDTTDPSVIGDLNTALTTIVYHVDAIGIVTTQFTASIVGQAAITSGRRVGFTWIAIGAQ